MVFSINADESSTSNETFADFLALALKSNIANPTIPEIEGGELIMSTSTSTLTASPIRHTMIVGSTSGSLTYDPSNITANIGDTVVFDFRAKNHSGRIF